jgi:Homeobox KN domain
MNDTGIEMKQLTNWFVNNRKRYWKPRVEARLQQQSQAAAVAAHAAAVAAVTVAQQQVQQAQQTQQQSSSAPPSPSSHAPSAINTTLVSPEAAFKTAIAASHSSNSRMVEGINIGGGNSSPQQVIQATLPAPTSSQPTGSSPTASLTVQLLAAHHHHQQQLGAVASLFSTSPHATSYLPAAVSTNSISAEELSSGDEDDRRQEPMTTILATLSSLPGEGPMTMNARNVSFTSLEQVSGEDTSQVGHSRSNAMVMIPHPVTESKPLSSKPHKKRKHVIEENDDSHTAAVEQSIVAPRKRFRRVSLDMWIESCLKAAHANDEALPSLEEASRLFGYSSSDNHS